MTWRFSTSFADKMTQLIWIVIWQGPGGRAEGMGYNKGSRGCSVTSWSPRSCVFNLLASGTPLAIALFACSLWNLRKSFWKIECNRDHIHFLTHACFTELVLSRDSDWLAGLHKSQLKLQDPASQPWATRLRADQASTDRPSWDFLGLTPSSASRMNMPLVLNYRGALLLLFPQAFPLPTKTLSRLLIT